MKHSWIILLVVACRTQTVVTYSTTHHAVLAFDDDHPEATACLQECRDLVGQSFGRCLAACPGSRAYEGACTGIDRGQQRACGEWDDATTETVDGDCDDLPAHGASHVLSCSKDHTLTTIGKVGIGLAIGIGVAAAVFLQIVANGIKA